MTIVQNLHLFDKCAGHENAFGVVINSKNIKVASAKAAEYLNELDWQIPVDFTLLDSELDIGFIKEVDNLSGYFGTGLKEPIILVESVELKKSQCQIMGKNEDTWKFIRDDNVQYIKFKNSDDDKIMMWLKSDSKENMHITVFGKVGFNAFGGLLTPQIVINEYEVI